MRRTVALKLLGKVPLALMLALLALTPATFPQTGSQSGSQAGGAEGFESLLRRGFDLHRQARFAEALPLLERALHLEPNDYFANLLVGIDLLRTGRPAEAEPRLALAARLKPAEEIAPEYLGEAEARLGRFGAAATAYRQALDRSKSSEDALTAWAGFALERFRSLGELLRSTAQGVEAQKHLAASGERAPTACATTLAALERQEIQAPRVAIQASLSACYAAEAGRAAERLAAAQGDPAALHRLKGDVLLRLKTDAPAAEAEYRQALALRPADPGLLERLAEAQFEAGEMDPARDSARAALAVDPHRREALRTLARLAMNARDYPAALPWLRQLRQEAPGDRAVQVELGRALAQTGADAEAASEIEPALKAGYPDEKGALHALLARVLRRLGRADEAARAEREARRLSDAFQAGGAPAGSRPLGPD